MAVMAGPALAGPAGDSVPRPPGRETVRSPDGRYALEIAIVVPPGSAAAERALGILTHDGTVVWRRALPPPVRPRFAVVSDSGQVALVGRWENTPRDLEISVLGAGGDRVAWLGREEIERAAGVPLAQMVAGARHGAWLDRLPELRGGQVLLGTAGRVLVLDLATGGLARAPQP